MPLKSIKKKIISTITWILFIAGTMTISVVMYVTYQQMDALEVTALQNLSLEKSSKISFFLKNSSDLAAHVAAFPEIINWTENPDSKNAAEALMFFDHVNIKKNYLAIYILDAKGVGLISTDPSFVGQDYSFRTYFQKAVSGQANMDVAIGVTSHAQGYYFAQPIKNNAGVIIGVLVLKLSPESIYSVFNSNDSTATTHIMISDQFGVVLYSDVKERIFSSLGNLTPESIAQLSKVQKFPDINIKPLQYEGAQKIIDSSIQQSSIYTFYDNQDNESETIAVSKVSGYPLYMVNEESSDVVTAGSIKLAVISSSLILILVLTVLLVLSLLISKKLRPLKKLRDMAKSIGQGNLEITNEIKSGDELEELGSFLSTMARKLHGYYEDLEEKVKERTEELNTKNNYLNRTKIATINILEDVQDERNKSEELAKNLEKFKLALDNASDHIVITDADGIVLYGNSGVEKITGYTLKEALGKKAGSLWSAPMPKEYYQKMWKTIKEDKKTYDGEIKNRRKNGHLYDARITISPILNDKKEVEFFIGIEKDITREKMIDQAKTEFVSLASHQLRTPLSSTNWYAEMLLAGDGGKLNAKQKSFVDEIYASNQVMVKLVDSLLNTSRLELGTFAIDLETTDILAIAQSVIDELKQGIIGKKIKLDFEHDKTIANIQADPKLLRMIFQNLLSNAIKYTPEKGSVILKIKKEGENINVEVTDTGYGIPKAEQPRMFEKLFRAKNVIDKGVEGTGLGLYIIKFIIDHAGWKISFKSEENKGTSFFIEIPLTGMKK